MISHRNLRRGLAVLAVSLAATPAFAAGRILDVRVGRHDEFTRIVFELDAPATHQVEQKPGSDELVIRLGAGSTAREILSTSDVVESVRLEPKGSETVARVSLTTSHVRVSELTLESPPRLVLDLRPGEPAPAAAPIAKPAPQPAAEPATPPAPAPTTVAPAPGPAIPPPAPSERAAADEDGAAGEMDENEALAQADIDELADEAADSQAEEAARAAAAEKQAAPAPPTPPAPRPAAPRLPPQAPPPPPSGLARYLPESIDPRILAGVVVVLGGFLIWGLFGRRDRTTREVEAVDQSPANVFADRPSLSGEPLATASSGATIDVPPEAEEAAVPPSDLPLFTPRPAEVSADDAEAMTDEDDMPAPLERATAPRHLSVVPEEPAAGIEPSGAVAAVAGTSFDVGSRVADLERRIALLERKLEDAADTRERLERQVVAQTEELRVQRAAIARTQRVLRTLARPDDLPIEPAPRGSGPTGSSS